MSLKEKKCRRGSFMMPNGECYSNTKIMKSLKRSANAPDEIGCTLETGPPGKGIWVSGKGRDLRIGRNYGRCVRLSSLSDTQRRRIFERRMRDHILTAYRAGRVGPI